MEYLATAHFSHSFPRIHRRILSVARVSPANYWHKIWIKQRCRESENKNAKSKQICRFYYNLSFSEDQTCGIYTHFRMDSCFVLFFAASYNAAALEFVYVLWSLFRTQHTYTNRLILNGMIRATKTFFVIHNLCNHKMYKWMNGARPLQ